MNINWKFASQLRIHNKNESTQHFMIKSMCAKILDKAGYVVETEKEISNKGENRVVDVYARSSRLKKNGTIFIEIETHPNKTKNARLINFYEGRVFYIIDAREISNDIKIMEKQIKFTIGF